MNHRRSLDLSAVRRIAVAPRRRFLRQAAAASAVVGVGSVFTGSAFAATDVDAMLEELGVTLPEVPEPVANYVPYVVENGFAYMAGQLAFQDGELMFPGKVPTDVSVEEAQQAARQCAINMIAAVRAACGGDFGRVRRLVRMQGFIASADDFDQQSTVMNGASDFMVEVFGDAGRHTRLALGANALPLNASVEVSGIFAVDA